MNRWGILVVALLVLSGCAVPVAGTPVAAPVTSGAGADAELVRWMNNFCGVANYLVASGGVSTGEPATDPAAAKKQLSEALGRVVDVLNVAVHDLGELTPAPAPAGDTAVQVTVEPLTKARDKLASAKSTVDGATGLTMDVYSTVLQNMTEAVGVMNEGVEKMTNVSLPPEFVAAGKEAANCKAK
ncbi:hypothetical protein [Actinosynnema sp. NPDC020468]|uniref:hypothetical protein n=1 Tax=Actinosynnema sp. NPDC020468 TaxID=3154488 RepID=UPI00340D2A0F